MGDKGGKSDMDRVGLFQEMTYVTIGDKYKPAGQSTFNDAAGKGKQMLPGGSKDKSARQDGYFSEKFNRVMDGEAYSDPVKLRRRYRMAEAKKNLSKAFLPTNGQKAMNGLGTFFGTIGGNVKAFSPVSKGGGSGKNPLKNVMTNPGKRGTGYGFAQVALNPYPQHAADDYNIGYRLLKKEVAQHKAQLKAGAFHLNMHPSDYFDGNPYRTDKPLPPLRKSADVTKKDVGPPFRPSNPGKVMGGMKAGTFEPYPLKSKDPYGIKDKRPVNVVNKSGRIFMPSQGPKTTPCKSIVNQNVVRSVNITNYRSVTVL
ncbi:UPF0602 protein C4orf47 homolog isoform X2 [Aplysia californica]|uniref:Cilia-and flagella-associated protein 96 n=1 Tax=Aplysia californica TaxID=6500 RepID=A0ABM0JC40_APLCA|nr:UPF0602 protein C4orf47 homolog isoform X2 [Aplysia californica]